MKRGGLPWRAWAMACCISVLCACTSGSEKPGPLDVNKDAEWTVFIYANGDSNLSISLLRDVIEMAKATFSDKVQVVAYADWDASQSVVLGEDEQPFPEGAQWIRIRGGDQTPEVFQEDAEQNFDDPAVLQVAVRKAFSQFPAKRRALILWDHGGGWQGGFGGDFQNGTAQSLVTMTAAQTASAIRQGLEQANLPPKLDLVAFDTCLMAGLEVAYEFREITSMYIANAELDYGDGWDYTATLNRLGAMPTQSTRDLAVGEVQDWDAHHREASVNDVLLRSHVAMDLSVMQDLLVSVGEVHAALPSDAAHPMVLGKGGFFSAPDYIGQLEVGGDSGLKDAGQVFARMASLATDPSLQAKLRNTLEKTKQMMVAHSQGTLRRDAQQVGVHVELSNASTLGSPVSPTVATTRLQMYTERAAGWAGASQWGGILDTLRQLDDTTPPTVNLTVDHHDNATPQSPPTLRLSATDDDVADVKIEIGKFDAEANRATLYGVIAVGALAPNEEYTVPWDGAVPAFQIDANTARTLFVDRWVRLGRDATNNDEIPPILAVPGVISHPSFEPMSGVILYQDGDAVASLVVVENGPSPITFSLKSLAEQFPGVQFVPLLVELDLETQEIELTASEAFDIPANGELAVGTRAAPAGEYFFLTTVTDLWGNEEVELRTVTLPDALAP
jgi:hypothetical protein